MQIITMYLRADSVNARLVDSYNQTISSLPALTRGMRAELILRLLDAEGEPLDGDLSAYASWDFVIADDWNTATPPQIRVTEGITVSGNEVHIPLTETNTEELISALGAVESKNFGCELAGFEALRCEVVDLDRDAATVLMVESNFQRSQILPSEKAFPLGCLPPRKSYLPAALPFPQMVLLRSSL